MAALKKEEETVSMFESFKEFKETKNIDRTTLMSVLEESFRNVIAKIFGSDENFDVIVNPDKGDFEIYRNRTVVADGVEHDDNKEITLTEARKIQADYEVGEDVSEKVDFSKFDPELLINAVTLKYTLKTFEDVLPYVSERCMLSDIASVKTGLLEFYKKSGRPFVSTHPMFGPSSVRRIIAGCCPSRCCWVQSLPLDG